MAKKLYKAPKHFTGSTITTKTHFGSHSEMIVDSSKSNIKLESNEILCVDDRGYYVTFKNRIDNGLADPNRYTDCKRVNAVFEEEIQGVDTEKPIE